MQKSLVFATILCISTSTAVCAKITPVTHLKTADKKFMQNTALEGMTEIQLSQVGERNAYDQQVKNFATKMIADHTMANNSLKELASEKGVILPNQLDKKHEAIVAKFSKLRGSKFDHDYIERMLKDHREAVSSLEAEKKKGEPELRNWCKETLPIMQEQIAIAQNISKTIERN